MPDTDETARQHMQQEAAQKLNGGQGEQPLLVVMSRAAPAESDLVILEGNEAVIRYCNPMSVGAEITQHLIGSAEGRFAIDHPAQPIQLTDQSPEQPGLRDLAKHSVEDEMAGNVGLL